MQGTGSYLATLLEMVPETGDHGGGGGPLVCSVPDCGRTCGLGPDGRPYKTCCRECATGKKKHGWQCDERDRHASKPPAADKPPALARDETMELE